MKQAVLRSPGSFEVSNAGAEPDPESCSCRVAACGVCASELDMYTGHTDRSFPILSGHEVSGVVERGGAGGHAAAAGRPRRDRGHRVGVLGVRPGAHRLRAPGGRHAAELALAEPVACAVNAVEIAEVGLGDDVAIVGAGFMGALVLKLILLKGPRHVFVADTRPEALARARRIGATHTIDARTESLVDVVRANTDRVPAGTFGDVGELDQVGADVTFEITGSQAPLKDVGDAAGWPARW